jgi:hypothetical protein
VLTIASFAYLILFLMPLFQILLELTIIINQDSLQEEK